MGARLRLVPGECLVARAVMVLQVAAVPVWGVTAIPVPWGSLEGVALSPGRAPPPPEVPRVLLRGPSAQPEGNGTPWSSARLPLPLPGLPPLSPRAAWGIS